MWNFTGFWPFPDRARSCGILHVGKGTAHQNVFTPGETNCACTILLNLSTTLPRLHSLMSFRSGGPGQARNEVWTDERGRVYSSRRDESGWSVPVRFLPEFAYFSRWFNFYGPQNRNPPPISLFYLCRCEWASGWPDRVPIRYKYTEDVIGHRRSLCGLASQGSHYPHPQPLFVEATLFGWSFFYKLRSTSYCTDRERV